ncbi:MULTISPECIES: YjjG family noncanonical pyrimidine nucleotidase [Lactobacillus]|uniref:Noncanonical pyrimidine nucleotidase, YjjG family n=1 Tax=Lactobacillus xujianguonis TaxID=2495899 RepID=A0A437SX80_9LACO|nr:MULTISPECIES: YjjG family noncanonical pyrimidine nucleotidase [Lactobacillus]RVU71536.1 noncanonical pyrimidine nucleotidase, YjjG family [Lactobacillus xujianguonis]RVU76723.1 noncanonical pyrimidine nucleotidase, YjjG family [Lactobacillus xujianguonis]
MRYHQIIFDVDDTLIDFATTEDFAFNSLFKAHHWPTSPDIQRRYHAYNQGLWRDLEQGKLNYEELSERCFRVFLKQNLDIDVDGQQTMDEYRSYFGEAHQLLPGVKDTLKFAKKAGYKLTVLSNGEKFMQRHRLKLAGIYDYFDLIVTSEEAHYQKPDEHAFDYFFSRTEIGPNETIFFGDGLQSDILGAEKYGLDSIWYNHRHRKNTLNLHPLFTVENYPQFVELMQQDFQKKY